MISVTDAHKSYGSTTALSGVTLTAPAGRVTAVVGPNGAGKSTLFRAILGLEQLDRGRALIDGQPFRAARAPLHTVGAAVDAGAFHPARRAIDEVRVAAVSQGISVRRADEVLDEVGLAPAQRRRVRALSLGMRQRLALAVALLGRPRNLILDEPLNGLDVDGIHWMRELLRDAAGSGCAVLVSSHVLAEVERLSGNVYVLSSGRMLAGADSGFAGSRGTHVVAVSDDPVGLARLLGSSASSTHREGRALLVRGMSLRAVAELAYRERFFLESLAESQDTLEVDYLRLVSEASAHPRSGAGREPAEADR